MRDFTIEAYKEYLKTIKNSFTNIIRFDEYFLSNPKPESFCIIRHDIDRIPKNALVMAEVENQFGIKASYYFRTKPHTLRPDIIKTVSALGHEIGYHYESLADTKGDKAKALEDFNVNLQKLRDITPIRTISMHGSLLSPYDNRDLWRDDMDSLKLKNELHILGEVYLDIDHKDIAYINDTGRNWKAVKDNVCDKTDSLIEADFNSQAELLDYFRQHTHKKIIFQVHPERWSSNTNQWILDYSKDIVANYGKRVVKALHKVKAG